MERENLKKFYLDWANEWLTIERMAEWYGLSELETRCRIDKGRSYHNEDCKT